MRILHISTGDTVGGAARAAHRLHRALHQMGIESHVWAQSKKSDDPTVAQSSGALGRVLNKLRGPVDRLPLWLYPSRNSGHYALQWLPGNTLRVLNDLEPDVVNLHWICDGFVSIRTIGCLAQPLVWTLHDMWPFTGGCHYSRDCRRYTETCGVCPQLQSIREWDLSRWTWRRKRSAWKDVDLTIVSPSQWLAKCARRSSLFKNLRIEVIPNGFNIDRFRPVDKLNARETLKLPPDEQLVLFGAMRATTDKRKGFGLLKSALRHLRRDIHHNRIDVVIMGATQPNSPSDLSFPSHYIGTLKDDFSLNLLYAAADVFVAPSRQDNLPNTVMEALACGTPCVAFDVGGMPDMIHHRQTGWLAKPFDTAHLARGIQWVLENDERHQKLSQNARQKAVSEFDHRLQARRYLELYNEILERRT